ncbi:MAG: hypothetical protein FP816_20980 [Desulfobacteraceae bacterium]|nr:hypothetical protein [Desulfobacteraceae bacterium]MBU4053939.1 hypothetical protein [Pseudomonadota bacterium]
MPKTLIYYHRSYRKITGSGRVFLGLLMATSLPLSMLILFFHSDVTAWVSVATKAALASYNPSWSIEVVEKTFLWNKMSFVSISGKIPSELTIAANGFLSLLMIVLLLLTRKGKNIAVYFIFLFGFNLASALFFSAFPGDFPYTAAEFSELYMKAQISMWLFIPIILGMAFLPLPGSLATKILLILATLSYSVGFCTLRYIIFLFIIKEYSIFYMALLFFAFGPLIDFVYIVGFYSVYNRRLAIQLKGSASVWKWSY